jgi:hypothetical protein
MGGTIMAKTIDLEYCTIVLSRILYVKEHESTSNFAGTVVFDNGKEIFIERRVDLEQIKDALRSEE